VRVIANTKKGPPLVEHKLNECRLKGKYIGEIQNIYIYIDAIGTHAQYVSNPLSKLEIT